MGKSNPKHRMEEIESEIRVRVRKSLLRRAELQILFPEGREMEPSFTGGLGFDTYRKYTNGGLDSISAYLLLREATQIAVKRESYGAAARLRDISFEVYELIKQIETGVDKGR